MAFGFAQPFVSRLGSISNRAEMSRPSPLAPLRPPPMPQAGGGGFPQLPGPTGPGTPMPVQTAPGAADTASVTPINGPPSFMPGISSANPLDPAAAGAAGGDAAAAGGGDIAELLAAIFGA